MKVKRIAILSILKPVDDTRMYHKMGKSLQNAGYEIHIAGFRGNVTNGDIRQYPIFDFPRLSLKRLLAPFRAFLWLLKIKPSLIIVTTHELLFPCLFYKILSGKKLLYDIQENYFLNILRTNAFPSILRIFISIYVRGKEQIMSYFINHFFIAESGYKRELPFLKNRFTTLENKAAPLSRKVEGIIKSKEYVKLIFSGTIAETTGIFECIEMARQLHLQDDRIRLHIVGACHITTTLEKLQKILYKNPWITLRGGDDLVPYPEVIKEIKSAHAGFIYYPDITLIENTIPTKLYEYLACQTPIILQDKEEWINLAQKYHAAIPISLPTFNPTGILNTLCTFQFYSHLPGEEVLWESEAKKLLNIVSYYIT